MEDAPVIQFRQAERSEPQTIHNNALVITAMIANYEVGRIFIDFGSSADILFGEVYDQMQLGDVSLEKVNTSLYGFAGEVVHPRGMVSLPLTMGRGTTRKICLLKFLVMDVPSAYNVILSRPTLITFQAVISIYHMKIKFPTPGGVGEVQGDPLQSKRCYNEAIREAEGPAKVQPAEELLNIEIIPENPDKATRIGSHLDEEAKKEITLCIQRNADIFAWTPQDLEGIDPQIPPSKKGKTPEGKNPGEAKGPAKVQPAEELLNIEIIPENPDKATRIGPHLDEEAKKEITLFLQRNADIFAWTQDLEGIDPQIPPSKKGKTPEGKNPREAEGPAKVQPAEELLNIEIIPENPDKATRIGSHLDEEAKKEITLFLQRNVDIFAWTPQDLEGIDPQVITHHLNIDPSYKPIKQKKRHFGPEKDKIIQAEIPPSKKGKTPEGKNPREAEGPAKVQPAEELLNIEIIPENPDKTTRIGSHLDEEAKKEITLCLQRNADIFAWTPQDLEGIDPQVITHHLNIDPSYKPIKQKKRHFEPEKDKIIQAEVSKLMAAGHIEEI
ncbi:UNVERIFIED_CONTAM: hypothetical protein Sradi_2368000 [Sesamum radiatum]|uniref:Reverse transcriptase domain-containing protein n=1 Tax=Sesamum radiatum TaxID=300843 RepID=A0AAW2T6K7_SESRA